jgi:hypothetical protein
MHPVKRQGLKIEATGDLMMAVTRRVLISEERISELLARMRVAEGASGQRVAPLQGGVGITSTYLASF